MNIHQISARDLPDLWFQAVNDILDHGRRFVIDRGSYAGQTRLDTAEPKRRRFGAVRTKQEVRI